MKAATPQLVALINGKEFFCADCYTFELVDGTVIRLTSADFNVEFGGDSTADSTVVTSDSSIITVDSMGATWITQPRIGGAQNRPLAHWNTSLDSDEWKVQIFPRSYDDFTGASFPDKIGNQPFLAAAAAGAFRAAKVLVRRAFFEGVGPSYPHSYASRTPVGLLTVFNGIVGGVELSSSTLTLTINDFRILLSAQMPRNIYQPSCRHKLFDARCTLSAAAFAYTSIVGAASTQSLINATVAAPTGSGTYILGKMVFTSGANAGQQRMVSDWNGATVFHLANPLPFQPATGDAFTIYPGCDKAMATCTAFGNIANFGGFPYIPIPESTM